MKSLLKSISWLDREGHNGTGKLYRLQIKFWSVYHLMKLLILH